MIIVKVVKHKFNFYEHIKSETWSSLRQIKKSFDINLNFRFEHIFFLCSTDSSVITWCLITWRKILFYWGLIYISQTSKIIAGQAIKINYMDGKVKSEHTNVYVRIFDTRLTHLALQSIFNQRRRPLHWDWCCTHIWKMENFWKIPI